MVRLKRGGETGARAAEAEALALSLPSDLTRPRRVPRRGGARALAPGEPDLQPSGIEREIERSCYRSAVARRRVSNAQLFLLRFLRREIAAVAFNEVLRDFALERDRDGSLNSPPSGGEITRIIDEIERAVLAADLGLYQRNGFPVRIESAVIPMSDAPERKTLVLRTQRIRSARPFVTRRGSSNSISGTESGRILTRL